MRYIPILISLLFLQASFCGQVDPQSPPLKQGQVLVRAFDAEATDVSGASILVDGAASGLQTPETIMLAAGEAATISLVLEGWSFAPADSEVTVADGEILTLDFLAEPITQPPSHLVIVEDFSNTGCSTCPQADEAMWDAASLANGEVLPLGLHVFWPDAQDPFYLYNPAMQAGRFNFYGVGAAPQIRVDGEVVTDPLDSEDILDAMEEHLAQEPMLDMTVSKSWGGADLTVSAEGTVLGEPESGNWRIYLVVYETEIHYEGGSNGQTEFLNQVRHINMDGSTPGVGLELEAGGAFSAEAVFAPDLNEVVADNLRAAVFVQNSDTRTILDASME